MVGHVKLHSSIYHSFLVVYYDHLLRSAGRDTRPIMGGLSQVIIREFLLLKFVCFELRSSTSAVLRMHLPRRDKFFDADWLNTSMQRGLRLGRSASLVDVRWTAQYGLHDLSPSALRCVNSIRVAPIARHIREPGPLLFFRHSLPLCSRTHVPLRSHTGVNLNR